MKKTMAKSDFCKSFDWSIEINWFGLSGLHSLGNNRNAKIELATRGTSGHYPGFLVTIINNHDGKIDQQFFEFDDYLNTSTSGRIDERNNYPLNGGRCFEVVSHTGWGWYIAKPKSTRPYCRAVETYLGMFR
jgi:hypothetical protein